MACRQVTAPPNHDQVENVFFQICPCARDRMDLVAPDHFGQRQPDLRRAHRAGHRQHHRSARIEMRAPPFRGINQRGRVEVPEMVADEVRNGSVAHVKKLRYF